jgi:serine/threonine protein phosphatase PrpC
MPFTHFVDVVAARANGQDRARVIEHPNGRVVVLADGAGGTGNGARAAQAIVDAVVDSPHHDFRELLTELDLDPARLHHGQSTAVIVSITEAGLTGASVGDSGAWTISPRGHIVDLTPHQHRKPLVGDGCLPVAIVGEPLGDCTFVAASDGLFRYARREDIARIVTTVELAAAARALIDLVRLPDGALQDDISIVLCRAR